MGRKRNLSSTEICTRSSKRTRRFRNVPQSTTSRPCDPGTSVPRDRLKFGLDVESIFERAGLTPLVLTRAEAARAEDTSSIGWTTFVKVFGGALSQGPHFFDVPGYEDFLFLCTSITAQPFMPIVPGEPGLLLRLPAVIETPQSNHDKTFHVLSSTQMAGGLHYRGMYTKIPLPQVQLTWTKFPDRVCRE